MPKRSHCCQAVLDKKDPRELGSLILKFLFKKKKQTNNNKSQNSNTSQIIFLRKTKMEKRSKSYDIGAKI